MEKSYKAVTFQELMQKTGFSKGAFFHYFKNKQEIFEAVIDIYIEKIDFTRISQNNLRDFLDAYFPEVRKMRTTSLTPEFAATVNPYPLMFEAMRMIPDFKSKMNRHEEKATAAWVNVITAARENNEIKTVLTDQQVARFFIDAGHGIVIHLIMTDNVAAIEQEILAAWNNIYLLIRT